jgi:hypothetical protein
MGWNTERRLDQFVGASYDRQIYGFTIEATLQQDRSKPTGGILESLVKSKKYATPLLLLSPELVPGMVTVYLVNGRFRPPA